MSEANTEARRIYWDANVFLSWLQKEEDSYRQIEGVFKKAEVGEIKIVTSAFTITEVLGQKDSSKITDEAKQAILSFFKKHFITVVNLDRQLADFAQQLSWASGVPKKDNIHVATAIIYKIPTLHTFDKKLLALSNKIPYKNNPFQKLLIEIPNEPLQRSLFDENLTRTERNARIQSGSKGATPITPTA